VWMILSATTVVSTTLTLILGIIVVVLALLDATSPYRARMAP